MSALKILTTVSKGTQPVQIPKDPSLALVILDLLGMDTTAQVIQVNQRKLSAVSTSKTPQLPASKAISSVTRPISYYSTRGGVFSWSRAVDSPNFNFTCIIFFSWQWITFFTVFSAFFLDEYSKHSQFSVPTVILKLYIVSPYLHITKKNYEYGVHPISDIDECYKNTHNCSKRNATCANTAGSFICSCKPGFTGDRQNCRGKILKSIISYTRKNSLLPLSPS